MNKYLSNEVRGQNPIEVKRLCYEFQARRRGHSLDFEELLVIRPITRVVVGIGE